MKVLVLSTSFPHLFNKVSGIFVYNLAFSLSKVCGLKVVTPACLGCTLPPDNISLDVKYCRYAPRKLERIAHLPGGFPAALKKNVFSAILLFFFMSLSLFFNLLKNIRAIDVVHANWSVSGLLASPVRLFGVKLVTTFRGEDVARAQDSFASRLVLRLCVLFSNKCVAVSSDMKRWIDDNIPNSKTVHINNGVDESILNIADKDVGHDVVRFICVGSLIDRKNIDSILSMLSTLKLGKSWFLDVVGDGPNLEKLKSLSVRLQLDDRINFHGALTPVEVAFLLKQSNIMLFASSSEGKPNAIIEAMASGLVVIAPNIPGVNEMIKHEMTGLLYPSDNLDVFRENVERVLSAPSLSSAMSKNAYSHILKYHGTWDECAKKYYQLFSSFVGEN